MGGKIHKRELSDKWCGKRLPRRPLLSLTLSTEARDYVYGVRDLSYSYLLLLIKRGGI
jgi:hypothetical protein